MFSRKELRAIYVAKVGSIDQLWMGKMKKHRHSSKIYITIKI